MNLEELTTKYQALLANSCFKGLKVATINHKPDVFMIGPQHIVKSPNGILDPNVESCYRCKQEYSNHTYDTVLFLKLVRSVDRKEAQGVINLVSNDMTKDKIDGIVMVETAEKFKIGN